MDNWYPVSSREIEQYLCPITTNTQELKTGYRKPVLAPIGANTGLKTLSCCVISGLSFCRPEEKSVGTKKTVAKISTTFSSFFSKKALQKRLSTAFLAMQRPQHG